MDGYLTPFLNTMTPPGGLAPYGQRYSGVGVKGNGYFGPLAHAGGALSSEISSEFDHNGKTIEHPLIVPTLNADELNHLLSGGQPTPPIYQKAQQWAIQRINQGKSPFAQ